MPTTTTPQRQGTPVHCVITPTPPQQQQPLWTVGALCPSLPSPLLFWQFSQVAAFDRPKLCGVVGRIALPRNLERNSASAGPRPQPSLLLPSRGPRSSQSKRPHFCCAIVQFVAKTRSLALFRALTPFRTQPNPLSLPFAVLWWKEPKNIG